MSRDTKDRLVPYLVLGDVALTFEMQQISLAEIREIFGDEMAAPLQALHELANKLGLEAGPTPLRCVPMKAPMVEVAVGVRAPDMARAVRASVADYDDSLQLMEAVTRLLATLGGFMTTGVAAVHVEQVSAADGAPDGAPVH